MNVFTEGIKFFNSQYACTYSQSNWRWNYSEQVIETKFSLKPKIKKIENSISSKRHEVNRVKHSLVFRMCILDAKIEKFRQIDFKRREILFNYFHRCSKCRKNAFKIAIVLWGVLKIICFKFFFDRDLKIMEVNLHLFDYLGLVFIMSPK